MPAFQQPVATGSKRKLDNQQIEGERSSKRPSTGTTNAASASYMEAWMVQWRTPQTRKNKTWDGDAVLVVLGHSATLYDVLDGKPICSGKPELPVYAEQSYRFSGKDIEVDRSMAWSEYTSGQCFGGKAQLIGVPDEAPARPAVLSKQFVPLKPRAVSQTNPPPTRERKGIPLQSVDLLSTANILEPVKTELDSEPAKESHWIANWRKVQSKKHKTWDGDAFVSHVGQKITMISEDGKIIATTAWKAQIMHSGLQLYMGGKEVELDSQISSSQLPTVVGGAANTSTDDILILPSAPTTTVAEPRAPTEQFIAPKSFYGIPPPKKPKGPLHDPHTEGAIVMKAPTKEHIKRNNKKNFNIVPVVVDPILSRHMRPHQKEGVKFLYECVMGLRKHEGNGCILADEMGLGKTLQTISLVWTLLKQNPYASGEPVVKKVLVVCPVSLVKNWKMEFQKWLGRDRVGVVACEKKNNSQISGFMNSKNLHVLVIGYERLKTVIKDLSFCVPPIGLIICDEGHRLKSANNKTSAMFQSLTTPRRIILSGTPIQNDLGEFHAMANFCNPGLLDDYQTFRRVYEGPILKSREPDRTTKELQLGESRAEQLTTVAKSFVLRRDATLLTNYLPPKHEYVVFVVPTPLQLAIFTKILNPDKLDNLIQSSTAESLALINMLTKISNSPILLKATVDKAKAKPTSAADTLKRAGVEDALKLLPSGAQIEDMKLSGKLTALAKLLAEIRQNTEEKVVVVSHYTSTLNILEAYAKKKRYNYYRLDGQTPQNKRQEYVNVFNKSTQQNGFIFLLSSKAGGVGINLIGASRLVLIDSDWNPAHDAQSMARIHRDGQKRPVFIYRFLTAGAIDEKIYQRQVTKLGLSESLMGSGTSTSKSDSFTRKELRDIFRIYSDTPCNTHDLLDCNCCEEEEKDGDTDSNADQAMDVSEDNSERGFIVASQVKLEHLKMDKAYLQKKKAELAGLSEWTHINCLRSTARDDVHDDILRKLIYKPKTAENLTKPMNLLELTDLDRILAMEDEKDLTVADIPGGNVSFIFAKSTQVTEADEVEDLKEN